VFQKFHRLRLSTIIPAFTMLCFFRIGGCTTVSPEDTVANFFERVKADDIVGAKAYATEDFGRRISNAKALADLIGFNPFQNGNNPFVRENLAGEPSGDKYKVWHKDKSYVVFILVKQDNKWKISDVTLNIQLPKLPGMAK